MGEQESVLLVAGTDGADLSKHELSGDKLHATKSEDFGKAAGRHIAVPHQLGGAKQWIGIEPELQLQLVPRPQDHVYSV